MTTCKDNKNPAGCHNLVPGPHLFEVYVQVSFFSGLFLIKFKKPL